MSHSWSRAGTCSRPVADSPGKWMIAIMIAAFLMALAAATSPVDHPQTFLASISGLPVKPNEYISGFSINTWGAEFGAICHIPPGWRITAGNSASPDGTLAGEGSQGVTFLNTKRLTELHGLALITLVAAVRKQEIKSTTGVQPATFSGHANVGSYGGDEVRQLPINYDNVTLKPARECPPVRP